MRVHWREQVERGLILPPLQCLVDVLACQPADLASAVADSLMHRMPQLAPDWPGFVSGAPAAHRWWLERVDGVCESGTETLFWFRMAPHGLPISRQRRIPGVGRVDFVIGDRLVIEVDGAEYHTDREQFESDRHRDALLSAIGYRVLRFSYRQVMVAWREVEAAVLAAVARGDHR
ncbi:MAG: endonuclease domain-containing protein [Rhodoglobus sp.]